MTGRDKAIEKFEFLDDFQPHPIARGGHLQTLSIKFIRPDFSVEQHDGATGFNVPDDSTPPDRLSGFYFPPIDPDRTAPPKPLVVVLHGMGGHALSGYMRSTAATLTARQFPVVLWNHRGAGESGKFCRGLHHPGYTDDLRHLFEHLRTQRYQWCRGGIASVAFSLGANLLLRYLGETGSDSVLVAASSVSAPIDMEITSKNLRTGTNRVFDRYLLKKQRDELLRENANLSDREREIINNVSSVWELDDQFTSRRFGLSGAAEYYRQNSAAPVLNQITTPTILFHAADDPVVDKNVFLDQQWPDDGPIYPALVSSGGHTGFYGSDGKRWHEHASANFFDWVMEKA